ncbi:MAG: DNA modification methylase [Candidatus Tokpelaia sp. JSC189]|nr:MAG: DNA modification methylase [Candidatus Tokpelaia sp. JSC189]
MVFDPIYGSGTACKMARLAKRKYLGIAVSQQYI